MTLPAFLSTVGAEGRLKPACRLQLIYGGLLGNFQGSATASWGLVGGIASAWESVCKPDSSLLLTGHCNNVQWGVLWKKKAFITWTYFTKLR